ncbi:putative minchromosome maintenance (MCM) complex subunit [Leptomonas pyrrhocoris]|uniref:DNA helicase n=1 Tax=Leptomonas pyrrhocoris TaxID=157538 RepID=A0A0N0VE66_LEPPY|nr:putative minchromosome maintenance (MCM) complex subunit [Leptomonas pyrrhocoris]XP_015655940.1 putative minchromosome maintenance (MCM) complex subunit [Leptomonas pyrrhocoris]KPA77500.1 putative minchromosome maintenance (MCM) complex subunit [Leptomonas pyrrhocoris]KPA77501.1 putative minchromosome maintenance (MCM) complex subunit [Leptomonas pyrrhocoris]|eukprot:XP_015655939.1 putative minchromosome maintenance (MCM) complex subunit [Leptomonas pyrrhocoris]
MDGGDDVASHFVDLTPVRPQRRREASPSQPPHTADAVSNGSRPNLSMNGGDATVASSSSFPSGPFLSTATAATATAQHQQQQRSEEYSYIWGTGIAVEVFRDEFQRYLENFSLSEVVSDHAGQQQRSISSPLSGASAGGSSRVASPLLNSNGSLSSMSLNTSLAAATTSHALHEKYYLKEFLRMHMQGRTTLELDFTWLQRIAPTLYAQTLHHPTECLQMMSAVAEEVYGDVLRHRHGIEVPEDSLITVAAKKLPTMCTLKELSPQHIEQLLAIKGMVIRVSKVIPEIRVACFQCWNCQYQERSVSGDKGRIFEPTRCSHCGKTYSFKLQHNLSLYEDKQLVKVQESPEHVSDGETPISIGVVVYGNMVDAVVPGDRIVVTGIYRSTPIRLNANTRIIKSIFSTHIDAVHMELVRATRLSDGASKGGGGSQTRLHLTTPTLATTKEAEADAASRAPLMDTARLDMFYSLAHRPDIYDILLHSFARTIWGHDDVKRGILAQLFGGTAKTFVFSERAGESTSPTGANGHARAATTTTSSNSAVFRSELNVLLCGDPGVAKSQLLTQVHEIAPRGVYTSGKGSSSVGLTAFVVQDSDTGELVLEPGALVLSDRGLCCIDEFDKMNDSTRSVLHEVMEQQTLSIAKAGIIAQLNARTSILAAANPKDSQWNPQLNVVENVQVEPTLLSRFDLIFLLLDRHDAVEDRRLASHVLSLYMDTAAGARTRRAVLNGRQRRRRRQQRGGGAEAESGSGEDDDNDAEEAASVSAQPRSTASVGDPTSVPSNTNGGDGARVDAVTGLPVAVQMELDGEVFLQGPADAAYMPSAILSEYIALARETIFPKLTEASHKQLARSYVELRQARGSSRTVSATLRQLESMIRLSEARAKMRYAGEVGVEDVVEAKRIISAALKEAATDPTTGLINLDMFHAADPTKNTMEGNMRRLEDLLERRFLAQGRRTVSVAELRSAFNEQQIGAARPMAPAQFVELLALLSGGDVVQSFTATTVTLSGSGAAAAAGMTPAMMSP